jgi:aspartate/methionine/tyrosine aminotransferase
LSAQARDQIRSLATSRIRELANAAMGREGVLPFWFGESDQPTPRFIAEAAIEGIEQGRTFYSHNMGSGRCARPSPAICRACTTSPSRPTGSQ